MKKTHTPHLQTPKEHKVQMDHEPIIISCVDLLKKMGDEKIVKKSKLRKKTDKKEKT